MTWFAVALVAIGLADLVGSVLSDDRHPRPATLVTSASAATGVAVAVVLHLTGGLVRPRDLLALAITVGGVVAGAPENPVRDAASTQAEADAKAGLEPVPPPAVATDLSWRNLMYAFQWWAFAAFPLWMWWRMLSAAVRDEREAAAEAGVAPTVPAG